MTLIRLFLLVAISICLVGCDSDLPGKPDPADRPVSEDKITDFAWLYGRNCAGCHGADGKLGPAPPLNDPLFLSIVPDDELSQVISIGRSGTPMPAFAHSSGGPLTDEQVAALAAGLKARWQKKNFKPPADTPAYLAENSGGAAPSNVEHGKELFERACATCHGPQGRGLPDGSAPGAINDPEALSLVSDQLLRRIIITGRADLGMPSFAGSDGRDAGFKPLTSEEITQLVELITSWRDRDARGK